MRSPDRLPVHSSTEFPPRQSKTRYYRHRVHESLSSKLCKIVCAVLLSALLVVGILFFVLWLSLRPHRPRFHIVDFSITGLDQPTGFQTTQIVFNATVRNTNQHIWFSYGSFEGAVYYKYDKLGSKMLLEPFKQEPKNTTVMYDTLSGDSLTVDSTWWSQIMNDRSLGTVLFRLEITSTIQFKVSKWDSKSHRVHASCDIGVGVDGVILAGFRNKRCPVYFI